MAEKGSICWSCQYLEEKNLSFDFNLEAQCGDVSDSSELMEDFIWRNLLTSALKEAWKNELYTDLEIIAVNGSLKAHKVVLASVSPYFRALLSVDLKESRSDILKLEGFDIETLETTLNYVYCGCASLTEDNASDILALADYFQIHALKKLCCAFIKRHTTPVNSIIVYELASLHHCHDLANYALMVAMNSCSKVIQDPSFVDAQPETLLTLLKQPILKINSEDELFKAAIGWYSYDPKCRAKWLPDLLALLKTPQLSPMMKIRMKEYLEQIHMKSPEIVSRVLPSNRPVEAYRHMKEDELLMVYGGEGNGPIYNHCECFAIGYSGWKCSIPPNEDGVRDLNKKEGEQVIPPMSHARSYAAVASFNNIIYLIGGLNSETFLDSCEKYDITKNRWESLPPLPAALHGPGASFLEHFLCVAGGKDSLSYRDDLLLFDLKHLKWLPKCRMSTPRAHCGVAALNDSLYAIGGMTGVKKNGRMFSKPLSSCERYDPLTDTWIPIAPLGHARAYHGVAVVSDCLYAIGGYDGDIWLNTVEKYEPLRNQWITVRSMVTSRSSFGVTVSQGRIYCMGGFSGKTVLNSAEKYNPRTDMWHCVQSMQLRRMGVCAATLKIPTDKVLLKRASNPNMAANFEGISFCILPRDV